MFGLIGVVLLATLVYIPHLIVYGRYFRQLTDNKFFKYTTSIFPTVLIFYLVLDESQIAEMYYDVFSLIALILFLATASFWSWFFLHDKVVSKFNFRLKGIVVVGCCVPFISMLIVLLIIREKPE